MIISMQASQLFMNYGGKNMNKLDKLFWITSNHFWVWVSRRGFRIDKRTHHNGKCKWMKDFMESLKDIEVE